MRTALFLLLACFTLGAQAQARTPFQVRCEDTISKTVSVLTAQQHGYTIDTHLPYKALTVMKGTARANTWVLGLPKTDSRVAIALAVPLGAYRGRASKRRASAARTVFSTRGRCSI